MDPGLPLDNETVAATDGFSFEPRSPMTGEVVTTPIRAGDEARMPLGGTRASGYGRLGGSAATDEFTELRWTAIEDPDRHDPIRSPRTRTSP